MEKETNLTAGSVDTELQESISSLVSALGGFNIETKQYKLGDESLACLRDLRKWIQFYDAKHNRQDVACAIANTTLLTVDIPSILGLWETDFRKRKDSYLDRVALACLELLVPLTWPIEIRGKQDTAEHFMQAVFLKKAQQKYKTAILSHETHGILRAIIRIAINSSLTTPYHNREPRDDGVITLVCSFFRNILAIDTGEDNDRAGVIEEFNRQKVFSFFITICSTVGTNIDSQDIVILESLYYLLRGIDPKLVYNIKKNDEPLHDLFQQDLKTLLDVEADMNRHQFKPSRHSRFGTMVSMNEGAGESVSISGQRAVTTMESTLNKLNNFKKWKKPKIRGSRDENDTASYNPSENPVNSDPDALKVVNSFCSEYIDCSFNPLFNKLRKQNRQQDLSNPHMLVCFCYVNGWFLEAEAARAESQNSEMNFRLVGTALTTNSFGYVLSLIRRAIEPGELKSTNLAHASMFFFRQILTALNSMSFCGDEELRDIAEGLKGRLFYEESYLTMLASLPRTSKGKSLVYACETVALCHVVLKMLDNYSKQNTAVFVKRKSKNSSRDDDENEEHPQAERSIKVSNERLFSFEKFVLKFINEPTIITYERVLSEYTSVSLDTIVQVFSFFRRTFAKTSVKSLFYRMSMMNILLELTDQNGLPKGSKARTAADEFLKYYIRKFATTAEAMPSLHIQTNYSMTINDAFYYDHSGTDKAVLKPPKYEYTLTARALREFSPEKQFAVIVASLIDSGKEGSLDWVEEILRSVVEDENTAASAGESKFTRRNLVSDKSKIKMIHNDGLLRLLLKVFGLYVNTAASQISIPSTIDDLDFITKLEWLAKYRKESVVFENNKVASDYISVEGSSSAYDFDDDDSDTDLPIRTNPERSSDNILGNDYQTIDNTEDPVESAPSQSKRNYSYAFDNNLNDELNESDGGTSESIASFTRRKLFVDDEDDDDD